MARRALSITAFIAAILGIVFMSTSAQAASATRASSFVYGAGGLLVKEIIEPGDSQLCLVTEYVYDDFGNKTSVTTRNCNGSAGEAAAPAAGTDGVIVSRTTSSTYDARGQFALSTKNALNHEETRTFDERFGAVKTLTGPNGLTTSWTYDGFGRKKLETRADGTTTAWTYSPYTDSATIKYYIVTTENNTWSSFAYYDSLNRKLVSDRYNMTGTGKIFEGKVIFDSNGRVAYSSLPWDNAQCTCPRYTVFEYDILGRVIKETAPDGGITTKSYNGLTTTVTNAKGQVTTTVKNSQGQTAFVTDAMGKSINYLYDPFGNLVKTTDALSNVTVLTYDLRGRKIRMDDPDMGTWYYYYNALGELIRQTDAKAQIVTMVYDKLGRMTSRSEPDLNATWTYDTAVKGIGKLATATSGNGYSRTHTYDTLGRLSSTGTVIDDPAKPYVTKVGYDNHGRVDTQTYPASPGHPNGFAVKNVYNGNSYLIQVVNAATPTKVYWTANAMDAQGHLTQQTYGNGVVTQQVYDPATGRLKQQLAGAGNAVQNTSYTYDSLGNLSTRTDVNQNLTETYTYDEINRIKTAQSISGAVNTTQSYTYNAIGNIATKSDVGTYFYPGVTGARQPHAVGRIDGATNPSTGNFHRSFLFYDANGNNTTMSQGDYTAAGVLVAGTQGTRTIAWTSFNMPSQITNCLPGATCKSTSFLYNPEHERTIENQADGSKVVALSPRYDTGLHFEKKLISNPATKQLTGAVEYEHYLYAGGIMFGKYVTVTQTDGVTLASAKTTYYSKDHLGSIVAITDEAGNIATDGSGQLARYSYDVWGKRRYPNGAADPNGLLNNPDMYHGYTGHEMLDDMGLIHMNGRLYDPVMARFVSADFLIQSPDNLQSYNRYSYGWNNPLSGTDPSGQSFWTSIRSIVVRAVAAVADAYGCAGYCSAAVGAYQGSQNGGGLTGAVVGGVQGYVGFQMSVNYPLTDQGGSILWQNVAIGSMVNAGMGCASAAASGGSCGRGALSGAAGTMGSAFGNVGAVIAGCAAGKISGGSCREGAINALETYAVYAAVHSAVSYITQSQEYVVNQLGDGCSMPTRACAAQRAQEQQAAEDFNRRTSNQAIEPVIVEDIIIGGLGALRGITRGAAEFFDGAIYHPRVLGQLKSGDLHAFPSSVEGFAAKYGSLTTTFDSRGRAVQMLSIKGEYRGGTGTFEFIKNDSNQIYHRFFRPDKP